MKKRWIIWGVVLALVVASVGALLAFNTSADPAVSIIDETPILATELPGTIEDNAAKAYRMLFQDLAQEAGAVDPNAYKTASVIKSDPGKYIAHADRIIEISLMERADWGVERDISSLVPHVSEMPALDKVLHAKAGALAAAGDGETLGTVLAARVRMAEHLAVGWSLIEWVTAERILLSALDDAEAAIGPLLASKPGADALATELEGIDAADPLGVKGAVESDMIIVAGGLRDGFFVDENIMIGSGDAPKLKGRRARRIARLIDELRPRIIAAMTITGPSDLIIALQNKFEHESSGNGWVISDFAKIHDRARVLSERITDLRERLRGADVTE